MTHERTVVPFRRWHYEWLAARSMPAEGAHFTPVEGAIAMLEGQNSWTAVVDGDPIACGGTIQQWPGRHHAWAYFALGTGRHMEWLTEQAQRVLAPVKGRIEFSVRKDFRAGQRWAKRIGFEVETLVLRGFGPQGEDHVGFVRLQ